MRRTRRGSPSAVATGLLAWLAAVAPAAAAGPASPPDAAAEPPEVQEARDAYRLGISLTKHGQWSDALAAFERSARLNPAAVTAFDIGYCERALGRFTRARRSFQRALGAPELPADKASETRGYLAEIESRLSRAVVTLSPAAAAVAVDGRPLEADGGDPRRAERIAGTREPGPPEVVGASSFTLVLDPGAHVIVVAAPGLPDAVVTRDLAPGATTTLTLSPGAAPAAPPLAPLAPLTPLDKPLPGRSAQRLGAVTAFGVGGAGVVVGAVFGALALVDKSALDRVCPQRDQCASSAQGTLSAMSGFAAASTAGFVVAGAGAGVGTLLLLTDGRAAPARVALSPSIGPGFTGLRGSF
jgi:hypothetical protein